MTAIATRSSVLGVRIEASEGVLLAPQSSSDYMPLQTDFTMNKNLEQIENLQLSGTIGATATILGAENPTAQFTFYLKAHTTEGTAPEWSDIFKAFFGDQDTEGTERATTTAAANVDTFTVESLAASTAADHGIFYDTNGDSWAWSLDKTGADAEPTNPLWAAVDATRKDHVDISGATTATDVANLLRTALNALTGFSALFTTSGTATLIITSDSVGYVPDGAVYADAGGAPSGLAYTHTTQGRTASSTTTLQSPSAEANGIERGYGMLIKDSTNGFRVRVADSVDGDAISLSFKVPTAPGSATSLGKPTYWTPENTGHVTLSLWWYGGNGGVVNAMAGARCSELAVTAQAGQPITCQASFEGLKFYVNPIEITSSTKYIDFVDDDGTWAAALTTGWYSDPMALAAAATDVMNAASTETHTVVYQNTDGKFKFTATGTVLTLKWATGANTANTAATKFGFTVADESGTGASTGYTSDNAITLTAPHTPSLDASQPLVAKNQEVMLGDQADYTCFGASNVTINGTNAIRMIESICAESGRSGSIVSKRDWEVQVTALAEKYDVDKQYRMAVGQTLRFQYTMGEKVGGVWQAGKIVYAYSPTCKVTNVEESDDDGLVTRTYTLKPYVNGDGEGEMYFGTL